MKYVLILILLLMAATVTNAAISQPGIVEGVRIFPTHDAFFGDNVCDDREEVCPPGSYIQGKSIPEYKECSTGGFDCKDLCRNLFNDGICDSKVEECKGRGSYVRGVSVEFCNECAKGSRDCTSEKSQQVYCGICYQLNEAKNDCEFVPAGQQDRCYTGYACNGKGSCVPSSCPFSCVDEDVCSLKKGVYKSTFQCPKKKIYINYEIPQLCCQLGTAEAPEEVIAAVDTVLDALESGIKKEEQRFTGFGVINYFNLVELFRSGSKLQNLDDQIDLYTAIRSDLESGRTMEEILNTYRSFLDSKGRINDAGKKFFQEKYGDLARPGKLFQKYDDECIEYIFQKIKENKENEKKAEIYECQRLALVVRNAILDLRVKEEAIVRNSINPLTLALERYDKAIRNNENIDELNSEIFYQIAELMKKKADEGLAVEFYNIIVENYKDTPRFNDAEKEVKGLTSKGHKAWVMTKEFGIAIVGLDNLIPINPCKGPIKIGCRFAGKAAGLGTKATVSPLKFAFRLPKLLLIDKEKAISTLIKDGVPTENAERTIELLKKVKDGTITTSEKIELRNILSIIPEEKIVRYVELSLKQEKGTITNTELVELGDIRSQYPGIGRFFVAGGALDFPVSDIGESIAKIIANGIKEKGDNPLSWHRLVYDLLRGIRYGDEPPNLITPQGVDIYVGQSSRGLAFRQDLEFLVQKIKTGEISRVQFNRFASGIGNTEKLAAYTRFFDDIVREVKGIIPVEELTKDILHGGQYFDFGSEVFVEFTAWTKKSTEQGWKLHLSATEETYDAIGNKVLPHLQKNGIPHKLVKRAKVGAINRGELDTTQVGKIITVYTENVADARKVAQDLDNLLGKGLNDLPLPPYDRKYPGQSGIISYRYGETSGWGEAYKGKIKDPQGNFVQDDKTRYKPTWVTEDIVP